MIERCQFVGNFEKLRTIIPKVRTPIPAPQIMEDYLLVRNDVGDYFSVLLTTVGSKSLCYE